MVETIILICATETPNMAGSMSLKTRRVGSFEPDTVGLGR